MAHGSGFVPEPALARPAGPRLLLAATLRRRGVRRVTSGLTVAVLLAGVAAFAYPSVTDLIGGVRQHQAAGTFHDPSLRTLYRRNAVPVGDGLTQLVIDNSRVHVNVLVVQGTTTAALEAGAGHYVDTPLPCQQGNVGIAGHRTTYGRPFNRIDQMRAGDTVTLVTPVSRCTYQVVPPFDHHSNPWIVAPTARGVVAQTGALGTGHWLTLTSCNPKGSNSQRIILRLRLVHHATRT